MTHFGTATGKGEYSMKFETDNPEHFEYMQRAARTCIDGNFADYPPAAPVLAEQFVKLKTELEQVKAERGELADAHIKSKEIIHQQSVKMREMDSTIKAQEAELEDYEARLQAALKAAGYHKSELLRMGAKLQNAQSDREAWKSTAHDFTEKVESEKACVKKLCSELDAKTAHVERLKIENEKLRAVVDTVTRDLERVKAERYAWREATEYLRKKFNFHPLGIYVRVPGSDEMIYLDFERHDRK